MRMARLTSVLALCAVAACGSSTVPDGGAGDAAPRLDALPALDANAARDANAVPDAAAIADDAAAVADDAAPAPDATAADASVPDATVTPLPGCMPAPPYTAPTPADGPIPGAGLVLWIRADMGLSLDGTGRVCAADDLSGSGHDFTQVAPASRGTVGTIGAHPALAFNGLQSLERGDVLGIAATSSRTVAVVVQLDAPAARSTPFMQGDPATLGIYLGPDISTFNSRGRRWGAYMTGNAYDGNVATSTGAAVQLWRIDSMTIGEPVLDHLSARINGAELTLTRTSGGDGNTRISRFANASKTWISVPRAGQDYQIAEVLVWSTPLTPAEITLVEAYLAARYGITL